MLPWLSTLLARSRNASYGTTPARSCAGWSVESRWESILGRWPAIVLASLVWAAWHVGIQGTGQLGTDLAVVAVNQGVTGLFLGYLWSRYRRMWPLLVTHGAINAAPILLGL
ncbi:CPBP family intramembrane metalloprotease [Micromonospora sp. NEAU-HG-1]|nr:CPBP family intramembrane metalloprotease [Micromonospora rubida]